MLSEKDKRTALEIARYVLESVVTKGKTPKPAEVKEKFELSDALTQKAGVFVTLKTGRGSAKRKSLRGCIGYITGVAPVYEAIISNAYNASTRDYRFDPVEPKELSKLSISVSVMSPLMECTPDDVVVGRDGLVLEYEGNRGVFLPQVPVECGWERIEYLEHLCTKAGVSTDKWKSKKAVLYHFTAQVFSEDDFPDLYKD